MRQHPAADVAASGDLAVRFAGRGVIGFDLAGPEAGFPATLHARTLRHLVASGVPLTLHAGEADVADRVLEAATLGARRIGHGVRLADAIGVREDLLDAVRERGLHLEVCPTSNVHTGAAASIATHPIRALWDAGISLSYHTDNRLISCIDLSTEAANLIDESRLHRSGPAEDGTAGGEEFVPAGRGACEGHGSDDGLGRHARRPMRHSCLRAERSPRRWAARSDPTARSSTSGSSSTDPAVASLLPYFDQGAEQSMAGPLQAVREGRQNEPRARRTAVAA